MANLASVWDNFPPIIGTSIYYILSTETVKFNRSSLSGTRYGHGLTTILIGKSGAIT